MRWLFASVLALLTGFAVADDYPCTLVYPGTSYGDHFGPFDYIDTANWAYNLPVVNKYHFDADVESLRTGKSTTNIGGDISYTLHAFPNHHRALQSAANLAFREGRDKPKYMRWSIDCYFQRAITYSRKDGIVKMLYGNYLARKGKVDLAIVQYEKARDEDGLKDANLFYALGLAYFRKGKLTMARESARKAYSRGYPLPALRNKLQNAGAWEVKD